MNKTHGKFGTRLYSIWSGVMFGRKHPRSVGFKYYKNVSICSAWKKFENFYDWAMSNGYAEHLTIDRKDNSKGYSPGNCRWVTYQEQARNRRSNVYVAFRGERLLAVQWAERLGVHRSTVTRRIKSGWTVRDACTLSSHRGMQPHERK